MNQSVKNRISESLSYLPPFVLVITNVINDVKKYKQLWDLKENELKENRLYPTSFFYDVNILYYFHTEKERILAKEILVANDILCYNFEEI